MRHIRWVWSMPDQKYRKYLFIAITISVVTSLMLLVNPTLTARLIDEVIMKQNPEPLMGLLMAMLIVKVLREGLRYLMIVLLEKTSQNALYNLRVRLFTRLQYREMRFFDQNRAGDLMTRLSADVDWCRHFFAFIIYAIVDNLVTFISTSIFFFFVNWKMALLLFCVTPLLMLLTKLYSKKARPLFIEMRDRLSEMNMRAQENIAANRVVKAFAREEYEKEQFDRKSRNFRDINLKINEQWLKFFPSIEIMANMMTLITVFVGALFMMNGELTAGELTLFTSLSWALSNPMRSLGVLLNDFQRFFTSADKVMQIELGRPQIRDEKDAVDHEHMQGKIEFDHVSFAYDRQEVLHDITFSAEAGQTVAIMGPTGSGKTTLIQLMARFYEPSAGEIRIDGDPIKQWKLDQLRGGIGTALQDVFLFSDTVDGNIAFGNTELSEDEVKDFATRADAHDFVSKLPEGYDTIVGERGVGLSGGQRQRLALARALAVKPGILVLDDTTSAVDMETEVYIQKQLRQLPYKCTRIIIAQRISSVKDADKILILRNGRISESGTHEELLQKRGYYYETYCLQNGIQPGEEAENGKK